MFIREHTHWKSERKNSSLAGIALDLEEAGILPEQIVLGFREPELRQHTGYAVA